MPKTKCVDCGRICWNCRKCHNRTYCEFCNSLQPARPGRADTRDDSPPSGARRTAVPGAGLVLHQTGMVGQFDVKVRAKGMAGAIWQGVRQARRENLKPRTHVRQVRVTALTA